MKKKVFPDPKFAFEVYLPSARIFKVAKIIMNRLLCQNSEGKESFRIVFSQSHDDRYNQPITKRPGDWGRIIKID